VFADPGGTGGKEGGRLVCAGSHHPSRRRIDAPANTHTRLAFHLNALSDVLLKPSF
jgi:hypothetical protein